MNAPEKVAVDQHQAADATVQEIEARRRHICGCKNPNFGFGPPCAGRSRHFGPAAGTCSTSSASFVGQGTSVPIGSPGFFDCYLEF